MYSVPTSYPILKLFKINVFDPRKYESVYSLRREYKSRLVAVLKASIILHFLAAQHLDDNAGNALDQFWNLFNHRCDPETINFTSGDIVTLAPFQRLKKDPQCECIAYNEYLGPDFLLHLSHCEVYSSANPIKKLRLSIVFGEFRNLAHITKVNDDAKVLLILDLFRVLDFHHRVHLYPTVEIIQIKMILADMVSALQYKY
ncbi:hypothetical protein PV327_001957 [Microctonus hyperodae]|uniref:Uncharacterized protein n=1 Tax=Microctonus hyperodae TaxID=165561 RepID=A0AA39FER8_MICHY|nr:hypothetical protein PV327_001957 [Microctonus hyperodae]